MPTIIQQLLKQLDITLDILYSLSSQMSDEKLLALRLSLGTSYSILVLQSLCAERPCLTLVRWIDSPPAPIDSSHKTVVDSGEEHIVNKEVSNGGSSCECNSLVPVTR